MPSSEYGVDFVTGLNGSYSFCIAIWIVFHSISKLPRGPVFQLLNRMAKTLLQICLGLCPEVLDISHLLMVIAEDSTEDAQHSCSYVANGK